MVRTQNWNGMELPDFPAMSPLHWRQKVDAAIEEADRALGVIVASEDPPTFLNVFVPLERRSSHLFDETVHVRSLLLLSDDPELQQLGEEMAGRLEGMSVAMFQNKALGARVKAASAGEWPEEERRLIEWYERRFRMAGAFLEPAAQDRLAQVCCALSEKMMQFGVMNQANGSRHILFPEGALQGVDPELTAQCAAFAAEQGEGGYAVPLQPAYLDQILSSCTVRSTRQSLSGEYAARGVGVWDQDTRPLIVEILALRQERARLLGYSSYAAMVMEDRMSKDPATAMTLVRETWDGLRPQVEKDLADLTEFAQQKGLSGQLEAWDVPFYLEALRQERYAIDAATVREYLPLERIRACAFAKAEELFGLKMVPAPDAPLPHPAATAYEVVDIKSTTVRGLLWLDDFARPGKSPGAWMQNLCAGGVIDGQKPMLVINCLNASPPSGDRPALLSLDEAVTLFHELGHGLHALCDTARYPSLSGPDVALDFVELQSQLLENWIKEPTHLSAAMRHWKTGEAPPPGMVEKLLASEKFGQSFGQASYLQSAWVDLVVHEDMQVASHPELAFRHEQDVSLLMQAPPALPPRHRLTHFSHLFGDEYAAGYYGYLWAEALEADVFARCKDVEAAGKNPGPLLRDTIYGRGNARAPELLFEDFMGRAPRPDAFLERLGVAKPPASGKAPRP